jgi:hypothetical protein
MNLIERSSPEVKAAVYYDGRRQAATLTRASEINRMRFLVGTGVVASEERQKWKWGLTSSKRLP